MNTEELFKSLAILESIKLNKKESFEGRLLKGWRGEHEFFKIAKKEKIECIEGPWIIRPTKIPIRFLFYINIGDIKSFPKQLIELKSQNLIPFILCASFQDISIPYPPRWYVTKSGTWKKEIKRPEILSVKYEVYDKHFSHIVTVDWENFQSLGMSPFNFNFTQRSRFFKYDQNYVNNIVSREKDSFEIDFLQTLYAKRFFFNYILSAFTFFETGIDIDAILIFNNKKFIIEIKEKFPIPQTNEFGWDAHRIVPYFFLQKEMEAKIIYCIREVISEVDRSFKDWKLIDLDNFLLYANYAAAIAGGAGAFGYKGTTTLQVSADLFYSLSHESLRNILNKIK